MFEMFNLGNLLGNLLEQYGYIAVFVGALVEGEIIISLAGSAAYFGSLSAWKIIALSTTATVLSEQICFYIGRFLGARYLHKIKRFKSPVEKAFVLVNRHQTLFILTCRFLYGLRTVSPFIIGAAKINPGKFAIFNVIAAFIWSVISVGIGYFGGYIADQLHYDGPFSKYAVTFIIITISIGVVFYIIKQLYKEDRNKF